LEQSASVLSETYFTFFSPKPPLQNSVLFTYVLDRSTALLHIVVYRSPRVGQLFFFYRTRGDVFVA